MKPTLLAHLLVCTFIGSTIFAQTIPTNNNFADAIVLTVPSGTCGSKTSGTTVGATDSGTGGVPSCGQGLGADVWYKVEVPSSGNLAIETFNVPNSTFDSVLTVYSGSSTSLKEEACAEAGGSSSGLSKVILTNQTGGDTLYIRVWGMKGTRAAFEICAWEPSALPANNYPTGAISLTVGQNACSTTLSGSTLNASNSGVTEANSCAASVSADVWYKVVVPDSENLVIETLNVSGSSFDSVLTAYSGTPGNLSEIACDYNGGPEKLSRLVLTGQTKNTTLYVRVWGFKGDRAEFEICASDPVFPANNNPADAIALTVDKDSCSTKHSGSLLNATPSGDGGTPNCGFFPQADVWYTVVVPQSGNIFIETFNESGSLFDSVITVYSGLPANLSEVACDDNGGFGKLSKLSLIGQSAGDMLYIRVWGFFGDRGPFKICAWEPKRPDNNDPTGATTLTVGNNSCDKKVSGFLGSATNTVSVGKPNCGSTPSSDVWYQLVVPDSGNISVETFNVPDSSFDSQISVYSGTVASGLNEISCNDDDPTSRPLSKITLSGQSKGTTLYVRVWGYDGERNSFEICAWDNMPLSTVDIIQQTFALYPNPTKEELHIEGQYTINSVAVYDLTGAKVFATDLAKNNAELDVSNLPAGIYLLRITHEEDSSYVKFIKE